jgi:3-oxoadipate enol-lactonase
MTTVTVAGQEVHVIDRGSGEPVVFLHAYPFNAAMWEYQYAALEGTHRVIGIDLPGFGSSPAMADPKTATMDSWADLVAGVLDELGLEQPVIVAASMGGYLTFELVRRHLDTLGPLVLVATRAKSDDVDTWEKRTQQQQALEGGEDLATMAKGMVEGLLSQASLDRPELVEYVLALMQHNLPEGWIAALEAMKKRPDAMGALRGMPRKTLVVAGELDRVTPLSESTLITRLVADGELVVVKDSSHLPNLENPVEFNEVLVRFLDSVQAADAASADDDAAGDAAGDAAPSAES